MTIATIWTSTGAYVLYAWIGLGICRAFARGWRESRDNAAAAVAPAVRPPSRTTTSGDHRFSDADHERALKAGQVAMARLNGTPR